MNPSRQDRVKQAVKKAELIPIRLNGLARTGV